MDKGQLEQRFKALLTDWGKHEVALHMNRDAYELDITVDEARARKMVLGNETFIGRRVIAENIKRELPVFIQYLKGSYRHVTASSDSVPLDQLNLIESAVTKSVRSGPWLATHIKSIMAMGLHGRGVFMVIPDAENAMDTDTVYVPTTDFIVPVNSRDFQQAPMMGVRYMISESQFKDWAKEYKWIPDKVKSILDALTTAESVHRNFKVYLVMTKSPMGIQQFWYSEDPNHMLSDPVPLFIGKMEQGPVDPMAPAQEPVYTGVPTDQYPIFPVFYEITENPVLIEIKGRAHADMHDQEALTMGWTSYVNGMIRASELFAARDQQAVVENPETLQTSVLIKPGVVTKEKLIFYTPPAPDAGCLMALQALRTENSSGAGQTDFAAANRQDSRKTATELNAAKEQAVQHQTVPLTNFAIGYSELLKFRWSIVQHNVRSGFNTKFMANHPEVRAVLDQVEILPAGDVDYVARSEKLSKFTNFYQLFAQTPVGIYFLKKILELAFPDEYQQMAPLLQDNSRAVGQLMLELLKGLPPQTLNTLPPELQGQLQQAIQTAEQLYGNSAGGPADTATRVAQPPNNANQAQGPTQ